MGMVYDGSPNSIYSAAESGLKKSLLWVCLFYSFLGVFTTGPWAQIDLISNFGIEINDF